MTPLSVHGLCEAETTTPASRLELRVSHATAGVGTTPAKRTVAPFATSPPESAATIVAEDSRVSQPTTTEIRGRASEVASAAPTFETVSASSGGTPASPRMPSVPKRARIRLRCYVTRREASPPPAASTARNRIVSSTSWTRTRTGRAVAAAAASATAARDSGRRSFDGRARDRPEERLARRADDERDAGRREAIQRAEEREVLLGRLAESETGVEKDLLFGNSGGDRAGAGVSKIRRHLGDDVRERRFFEGGRGGSAAVVEDDGGACRGDRRKQFVRRVEAGHHVDDVGARFERGAGHLGAPRVDGERKRRESSSKEREDGNDAGDLLIRRNLPGSLSVGRSLGPRALPADVDDRRPEVREAHALFRRGLRAREAPAVAEGVGRDVQDRHDRREGSERQGAARARA